MAMTDTELAAITSARNSGVTTVSYAGRTVTYRSLAELDKIIADENALRSCGRVSFVRMKTRRDTG